MICDYAGVLPPGDPLHAFLAERVYSEILGLGKSSRIFDRYNLDHSDTVVRYTDRTSGFSVVGKFYGNKWIDGRQSGEPERRAKLMRQEFEKLRRLRSLGFRDPPRRVVRPLVTSQRLDCLLVEEWAAGVDLDVSVREAIHTGRQDLLLLRVCEVAEFLAELHQKTARSVAVDPARGPDYLEKILGQLTAWHILPEEPARRLAGLGAIWRSYGVLATGRQVVVHGDAIPPHFLFDDEGLTCIDVERLHDGDRAADLGCVAAELKHLFLLYSGERWSSEPAIRRLYSAYFHQLPPGEEDFPVLTTRGRFYMGCYLLRIARNSWLDLEYRHDLIAEAQRCLHL